MNITNLKKKKSRLQPAGRWIRSDKRLALYIRDNFQCRYCAEDLCVYDSFWVTLDHLVPRRNGGSNHESNLITVCRSCNSSKRSKVIKIRHLRKHLNQDITQYKKIVRNLTYNLPYKHAFRVAQSISASAKPFSS